MLITLSPMRRDDVLTVAVAAAGTVLVVNDTAITLADYVAGTCPWIIGQPIRQDDRWQVALILPYGPIADPADPAAAAVLFPTPIAVNTDGPVPLPVWSPPIDASDQDAIEPDDAGPDGERRGFSLSAPAARFAAWGSDAG